MAGDWKLVKLDQLYEFSSGLSKPRSEFGDGYPFLTFKDVFYNTFVPVLTERVRTSESERARLSIKRGDVFLTRTSETMDELGMSCVALTDIPDATFNGFTKRLRPRSQDIEPEYAGYFFRSTDFRNEIYAMSTLSTRASLNEEMLSRLSIKVPPIKEQLAIGRVLKSLDDKIELNRRMAETLGAMAQALFKSWFVDFDPVRAKGQGLPTGLPEDVNALFPGEFEDSKLGQVPRGWKVGRLDEVLVLQRGFDLPNTSRSPGPYPVIAASGPSGHHDQFMVRGPGVTTGRSGVLGKVFFVHEDFWPLNTSLWVKEFKSVTPSYAYHLLRGLDFAIFNAGSAVPTLNRNHVHGLPTLVPPPALVQKFDTAVLSFFGRQRSAEEESRSLAALRDTLLPRLISGELHINDAESAIEAA